MYRPESSKDSAESLTPELSDLPRGRQALVAQGVMKATFLEECQGNLDAAS